MKCVRSLTVNGFRGIRQGTLHLADHTLLIGPNNVGKSTFIEALALLLGRDRLVRQLTEHDFCGSSPTVNDRIVITAVIGGFEPNDEAHHRTWFRSGRAVPHWCNSKTGDLAPQPTAECTELCARIGFAAFFNHETLSAESRRFFVDAVDPGDPFLPEVAESIPPALLADIGFFLVSASRTWDRMISFNSELFRRVVSSVTKLPAEAVMDERERLRNPDQKLEETEQFKELIERVNTEVTGLFPGAPKLQLRLTSTDSEGVLQALMPHYKVGDQPPLPAGRHGVGLVSVQSLLLLLEFGRLRREENKGFCVAFEEPELHVPPSLQRRLVHRTQSLTTQTIVTTHSPAAASFYRPENIRVLRNVEGRVTAAPLVTKPLDREVSNAIHKLFRDSRADTISALMQEHVLIPEGRLDFEWLKGLVTITETQEALALDADAIGTFGARVGVIPTHDASIIPTYEHLRPLHRSIGVLVDGDAAGDGYLESLIGEGNPPVTALRWATGWVLEDAIIWILRAGPFPSTVGELTAADNFDTLRDSLTVARRDGGTKDDVVVREAILRAISENHQTLRRSRTILAALAGAFVDPNRPGTAPVPGCPMFVREVQCL